MRLIALALLVVITSNNVKAQCGAPTGLWTGPTATAATAHWDAVSGALTYDIDYKLSSSPDWIPYVYGANSLQVNFYNLQATTSYDWRVRANCSTGTGSFSATTFTTGSTGSCLPPGGLTVAGVSSNLANVAWNAVSGAYGYTVEYKATSSNYWLVAGNVSTTALTIYSLSPGTTYDWRVSTNCSLIETSVPASAQLTTSGSGSGGTTTCPGTYDVSTNATPSGASTIPLNTDIKGTVSQKGDIDYYAFPITTGGTITVSLSTLPANYDLAIVNGIGTTLASSQNKSTKSESISLNVGAGTYYARVSPVGTANNARSCYTLRVQTGTAARTMSSVTEEFVNSEFRINLFPNPASDQLNVWVEGVDKNPEIKVFNLVGKLVMQQQASKAQTQLNISRLPAGIYMLNVNNGKETKTAKFIKG